jgi:hypothetical protein
MTLGSPSDDVDEDTDEENDDVFFDLTEVMSVL